MSTRLRVTALLEVVFLLVGPQVTAQTKGDAVLAGVDSVDAQVALTWDKRIPNLDENTVRSRLQTVFELELRQRGIVVSTGADNYLTVALTLLYNQAGTVSFAHHISLSEPGLPKRNINEVLLKSLANLDFKRWQVIRTSDSARASLELRAKMWESFWSAYRDTSTTTWMITWMGPNGVVHVGRDNLQDALEKVTIEMAQAFANAYIAVHPRR
jgi:hypothetical protein